MLTLEQVQGIWDRTFATLKPYFQGGEYKPKYEGGEMRRPEFWPGYCESVKERESLLPHIEFGYYAERLFRERAPNMSEAEEKYMRANYRQTTLPVYSDFENTLLRALNSSNLNIEYSDSEVTQGSQEEFKTYVTTEIPEFKSLVSYVRYIVPKIKTADAMGVLAVLPKTIETIEGEDGEIVIDPSKHIDPVPYYFPVDNVWGYEYDKWYLMLTEERSVVRFRNKSVEEGLVFVLIDDQNIWRIEQFGERIDATFRIFLWFEHNIGYAPCDHLMGTPCIYKGKLRWQSHYLPVKEPLDIVLRDTSFLETSKAVGVFPYRVMVGKPCDFVAADKITRCGGTGKLLYFDGEVVSRVETCPRCNGQGTASRLTPMGVMILDPPDANRPGEAVKAGDAISWTGPETTTLEFLQAQIDTNMVSARKILHMSGDQPITGGDAKTATETGIDLRAQMAFTGPIANQYYDLLEFLYDATGKMRYGSGFKGVVIQRPTTFELRTEADYLNELQKAYSQETPLPQAVISYLLWGYLKSRYTEGSEAMQAFEVISAADKLFGVPTKDIQYQLSQNLVEPWRVVLHNMALPIYADLKDQGELTDDEQANVALMETKAKELTPQAKVDPGVQGVFAAIGKK